ncbi:UDP-N-acetylglucosamine 1-carboxyvinyltransferase [Candidatus Tachikawaea gelatinosa]|uniref:UDP-N-acetylglucosamine 1-carboxyvinyltransferase n=1 Tax=Candidatus Tachikawaea gelatinosa TaxID=1410383 RepID=A0A090AS51_9ENTR|nr:UDP-N-acetylglucosamine 1-carboxyvinyltransferase [Candidatus Tachikawaea gelatinosa]BAP58685.1 UDP-N-acetylglucosamine 1-carboxyvinyltransferase [Candidatus Tachikawaea gelatinosa]
MHKFRIQGPTCLSGEVKISGAKNAALPILFCTILSKEEIKIKNVPKLKDIDTAIKLLKLLGSKIENKESIFFINNKDINKFNVPYNLTKKMRASIWILGPLISRFGHGEVSLPGGCSIGNRPIDFHIYGLKKLGANIDIENNYIKAFNKGRLKGARIVMKKKSVGATLTIMSAATLATGKTIIENAACEPEIVDTANFLKSLGAKINGAGSKKIIIEGVKQLKGGTYSIMPDRIETATFLLAATVSGGKIICRNTNPNFLRVVLKKLQQAGSEIKIGKTWISIDMHKKRPKSVDLYTAPYPGFPTDLQAQFTLLNLIAEGNSTITENIFEDRFSHISELIKMGACAKIKKNTIICYGVKKLYGATVKATDLRASASLVLAGCIAHGTTLINHINHIDRGYENVEKKLKSIGANIIRIKNYK